MFHVELRQFPHVAREFNLTAQELQARVVGPLSRGEMVALGDRRWAPERARLTVYEGPQLGPAEIGMGRGWSNARRGGEEVTDRLLEAVSSGLGPGADRVRVDALKREILTRCGPGRISLQEALRLVNDHDPQLRVSDRLALVERSVWEMLHQGRLTMLTAGADGHEAKPVATEDWQALLLTWSTWADPGPPSVLLEAC